MVNKIIANEVIKYIEKIKETDGAIVIQKYIIDQASNKMLGFLGDYWRLKIEIITSDNETEWKHFFIKTISLSNTAKANMVKEMNLFEKELYFYNVIKKKISIQSIKPWSADLVTSTKEAMIFKDLNNIHYKTRNKFKVYDMKHTLLALRTLARLHACSLIYEEKRSKELQRQYFIYQEYPLADSGYKTTSTWFLQCMKGALESVKTHSKYSNNPDVLRQIENKWLSVWKKSMELNEIPNKHRSVICHRDLWNNNIMFRYETDDNVSPKDCILVDFAAVSYQPPAGDILLLLYCTLDPVFREENMNYFLNYYYEELKSILYNNDVILTNIIPFDDFMASCEEQRLWGVIVSACLVPQFWIDDDLTKIFFCDTEKFEKILNNDKATFIKTMIESNDDYKNKVLQIFEEIVERYCLDK